jgi:hypothetical protein
MPARPHMTGDQLSDVVSLLLGAGRETGQRVAVRPGYECGVRLSLVGTFQGQSCHTHYWPKEPVSFEGKRVAVIGAGATGVQTITEVAKTIGHPTLFQRTPQPCAPLHNAKIGKEEMRRI